jgi:perosamine synthetase
MADPSTVDIEGVLTEEPRAPVEWTRRRRRIALLGGTTSWRDCFVALTYLLRVRRLVRGASIREFESAFAREVGVGHAISFATGRVGLYGLLLALGVGEGDEVLVPAPTHVVVPNAVRYAGAKPVFVDCDPETWGIDLAQAEERTTPRTKVLLLQHTFGIPTDIDAALAFARNHGLYVIEDCVHALGATYDGASVGRFGVAGFFSTEETKTISTTMGGMVVTGDDDLADKMRQFQSECAWPSTGLTAQYMLKLIAYHLLTEPRIHWYSSKLYSLVGRRNPLPDATYVVERRGGRPVDYETRLSNAQAALGLRQLMRLADNVWHRRRIAAAYRSLLANTAFRPPSSPPRAEPAPVRFPIVVADRERVVDDLNPWLGLGTWFTSVLEEADAPSVAGYEEGTCPVAESASRHLINLPTHGRVALEDVGWIVAAVAEVARERPGEGDGSSED